MTDCCSRHSIDPLVALWKSPTVSIYVYHRFSSLWISVSPRGCPFLGCPLRDLQSGRRQEDINTITHVRPESVFTNQVKDQGSHKESGPGNAHTDQLLRIEYPPTPLSHINHDSLSTSVTVHRPAKISYVLCEVFTSDPQKWDTGRFFRHLFLWGYKDLFHTKIVTLIGYRENWISFSYTLLITLRLEVWKYL